MPNPWLKLPLADYEGHMTLPTVGQAALLADLFEQALHDHRPQSVAMFGCAGGNGFERIDPDCTTRVVGVDVNPEYIQTTRDRFAASLQGLELHVADVSDWNWRIAPVDLIFTGLLLEYVELGAAVATIRRSLNPDGVWVAVIQLPSQVQPFLSPSPFRSLEAVAAAARYVDPDSLIGSAGKAGFDLMANREELSAAHKPFRVMTFV